MRIEDIDNNCNMISTNTWVKYYNICEKNKIINYFYKNNDDINSPLSFMIEGIFLKYNIKFK